MSHRLLVGGYFGCGNLGDDSLLLGFLQLVSREGHDVTVMAGSPQDIHRNLGVRAIPRKDVGAFRAALAENDALVLPGGSLFQDASSTRSVLYYQQLVAQAKKAGKRVILLGQGVGPLTSFMGKRLAGMAFRAADAIAVRDPDSATVIRNLGVPGTATLTGDLAFLLPKPAASEDVQNFQVGGMRSVGIAPRPFGKNNASTVTLYAEFCRALFARQVMPVLIEMDAEHDGPLILEIEKACGGKVPSLRRLSHPTQLQSRLMRLDAVVAVRLHAGILAASLGVPPYLVGYDPKVTALAKQLDLPCAPAPDRLTAERLTEGLMDFLRQRDALATRLPGRVTPLVEGASRNLSVLQAALASATRP